MVPVPLSVPVPVPFVLPAPLLEIILVPILAVQDVPVPPTALTGPAGRALPRPVSFPGGKKSVWSPAETPRSRAAPRGRVPGGAAAGACAVGLGFDPVQAVFEGREEDAAPLVVGNAGLFDDGNGCQEGLNGIAVITCGEQRNGEGCGKLQAQG